MKGLFQRLLRLNYLTILIAVFVSSHAKAGCDSAAGICKVITGQEDKEVSCHVKVCASANDYMIKWILADKTQIMEQSGPETDMTTSINGELADTITQEQSGDNYTCYALNGSAIKYCIKYPEF